MTKIYHTEDFISISLDRTKLAGAKARLVAEVDTDDLKEAFRLTNNIDRDWTTNEGVAARVSHVRSTSVGNLVSKNGKVFLCAYIGWKELTSEEIASIDFEERI